MTELWWIFPIVMIILCIFMMRGCMGVRPTGHGRSAGGSSAHDILDMRYAKGEIDRREYEEKKRNLAQSGN